MKIYLLVVENEKKAICVDYEVRFLYFCFPCELRRWKVQTSEKLADDFDTRVVVKRADWSTIERGSRVNGSKNLAEMELRSRINLSVLHSRYARGRRKRLRSLSLYIDFRISMSPTL